VAKSHQLWVDTELRNELQEHPLPLPRTSNGLKLYKQKPQLRLPSGMTSGKGMRQQVVEMPAVTQGRAALEGGRSWASVVGCSGWVAHSREYRKGLE